MLFAITLALGFILFVWLVFFKFKWLKFSIAWAIVSASLPACVLIFLIGLRFVTPYTADAKVIQHTIQLVPRLPALKVRRVKSLLAPVVTVVVSLCIGLSGLP